MNCVQTLDLVTEALDGALGESQRVEFEGHVRACTACGRYVDQLRIAIEALRRLPKSGRANPRRAELIEEFRKQFR